MYIIMELKTTRNKFSRIIMFKKVSYSSRKRSKMTWKTRPKRWSNRLLVKYRKLKPYSLQMILYFIRILDRFSCRQPSHPIMLILEVPRCKTTKNHPISLNHRMIWIFSASHKGAYFRALIFKILNYRTHSFRIPNWWTRASEGTEAMKRYSQK